jgi:hypothetical protein
MNAGPTLAKTVWTHADFDQMTWHDNELHAIALEPALPEPGRLLLDIDCIVQWVPPEPPSDRLGLWICPATLVFDPAWDLTTDIDLRGWAFSLSLLSVQRSDPDEDGSFDRTLAGDQFTIKLGAPGFTQYLRRPPVYTSRARLTAEERGGFSFDRQAYTL